MKDTIDLLVTTIAGIDNSINQQKSQIKFAEDQILSLTSKRESYSKDLETAKSLVPKTEA